jgi:hypothetical protein
MDWDNVLSRLRNAAVDLKLVDDILKEDDRQHGSFSLLSEEVEDIYRRLEEARGSLEVDREVERRRSSEA